MHGWEPCRTYDTLPMGWGKVKDIATASQQLVSILNSPLWKFIYHCSEMQAGITVLSLLLVTMAVQIAMGRFTVMFRAMTLRKFELSSIGKCPNFVDKGPRCDLLLLYGSRCDIASLPRTPSRNYWRCDKTVWGSLYSGAQGTRLENKNLVLVRVVNSFQYES